METKASFGSDTDPVMAIVPFPHNTSGDMTGVVASSEGNDRVSVTTALPGHYTLQPITVTWTLSRLLLQDMLI
jgi:hypothetical protein